MIAKCVLLSPEHVGMWFKHLHIIKENRKQDAVCTAATRKQKQQEKQQDRESSCYCAACQTPYQEFTDSTEGCEMCNLWFYFACVSMTLHVFQRSCTVRNAPVFGSRYKH